MNKVHWIVGLSNGENHKEGKGHYQRIDGALSPWQRLLANMKERGLHITSLSLGTDDGKRWNLPSAGKNPKFKAFAEAPKPLSYRAYRKLGLDVISEAERIEDRYTIAEATYDDGRKLQIWVDEKTLNSWSIII